MAVRAEHLHKPGKSRGLIAAAREFRWNVQDARTAGVDREKGSLLTDPNRERRPKIGAAANQEAFRVQHRARLNEGGETSRNRTGTRRGIIEEGTDLGDGGGPGNPDRDHMGGN